MKNNDKSTIKITGLMGILDDESIKHKELDFDKVCPPDLMRPIDNKESALGKDIGESLEEQYPFDMSFIEAIND